MLIFQESEDSKEKREFENQLDYNFQGGQTSWMRAEINSDIVLRLQLQTVMEDEIESVYVTDLLLERSHK